MSNLLCPCLFLLLVVLISIDHALIEAVTPPPYGQLAVNGKVLIEKSSKKIVSLHGVSLYWSQWLPKFWVTQTVNKIKCACNANVVRAAMGTQRSFNGYVANPSVEFAKMKTIIEAALDQGIYVVVDWHTGDDLATDEINSAKEFFTKIAQTYGAKNPHIIYEIWNEPNKQVTWEGVIKPYAKTMIDLIRKFDKNNIIVVGTPNWDQDVDVVAKSPLTGVTNIAYSLHFYAGSHKEPIRQKAKNAYKLGLPMFVTEYGAFSEDKNEAANLKEMDQWYAVMDSQKMSYTAWHLADIGEQSSILTKDIAINNICNPSFLTTYGKYIINKLKAQNNGVKCNG